jgi:hypothetical protein
LKTSPLRARQVESQTEARKEAAISHLLIVQSSARDCVREYFTRGVTSFNQLHKLRPCDSVTSPGLAVSVFPRTKTRPSKIVRANSGSQWICGAGTWFYQTLSGEEGLRRLLEHESFSTAPDAYLQDLDGQFVLAWGDERSGECMVVTDRLGVLHIYAAEIGAAQVISTSSMVLAVLASAEWDAEGCRQFLGSGSLFEPKRSLFRGIDKLEDARQCFFADGRLRSQRRYWSVEAVVRANDGTPVKVNQVAAALEKSLCTIYQNFPNPLLDFTGGFDTRGLVGAMLKANLDLDVVVNGSDRSIDVQASTGIAQEMGLRHHRRFRGFTSTQQWWERSKESLAYCDGECDVLGYAGTLEAQLRNSEGFDASVNGAIGEILKGHWWELLFPHTGSHRHLDCHLVAARRFTFEGEAPGLLAFDYPVGLTDYYAEVVRQTIRGLENLPNTVQLDAVYLIIRQQKWLGRTASSTDHVWPCISPYGFKRPLELAISASTSAKTHHRMSRRLIEYENPRLASMPLPEGYPTLPLRLTTAHKFWPLFLHYGRLVTGRLLKEARLRRRERSVHALYPRAAMGLSQLAELEEVRTLLDPCQMYTRDLYHADVLRDELKKCVGPPSAKAYRMGRILTLELLSRSIRAAKDLPHGTE